MAAGMEQIAKSAQRLPGGVHDQVAECVMPTVGCADSISLAETVYADCQLAHLLPVLYQIRKGALHAAKHDQPANQYCQGRHCRHGNYRPRSLVRVKHRPPKTLNNASHGIETVKSAPGLWQQTAGVDNGCAKHPELNEKRHDVLYIPELHVQRGKPETG